MTQIRLKLPILLFIFIFSILSFSACRPKQEGLVIFAASSLNEAFSEIITEFVRLNPDIEIATSYASSSTLRIQIEEGAAADIYASANLLHKDILESQGLIASNSQIIFARNKMGIAYNFVGQDEFSLDLLIQPGLRIVMALPEVPAGAYAIEVLALLEKDFGQSFSTSLLNNVRSYENSVRKALLKVELGEADAAFVYSSDALLIENSHFFLLPDFAQPEIYYVAAEIFSDRGQGAQRFLDFLLAPKAQTILTKWGFELP